MSQEDAATLDGDLMIGEFLVRPLLKEVVRIDADGKQLEDRNLPDKALGVLLHLAKNPRRVCERDAILDAVWGEERDAHDRVLDNAIMEIRRAFGDDSRSPTYVQTVPKRGYRLLIEPLGSQLDANDDAPHESEAPVHPPEADRAAAWLHRLALVFACSAPLWLTEAEPSAMSIGVDTPSNELHQLVRQSLLSHRECLESSHLAVTRGTRSAEIEVDIVMRPGHSGTLTSARLRSAHRDMVVSVRNLHSDAGSESRFRQNLRSATDQLLCESDRLSSRDAACLCLRAAEPMVAQQRPSEVLPLLQRAVELDPDLLQAYDRLAQAYVMLGDPETAERMLRDGLDRVQSVDSDIGLALRRRLASVLDDYETEWNLLVELARRHPDEARWRSAQAKNLTMHQGACQEALELLASFPGPSNLEMDLETARALVTCGRIDEAITLLQRITTDAPRELEARNWLLAALSMRGRLRDAIRVAGEVLALAPADLESYVLKAWLTLSSGRAGEARTWVEKGRQFAQFPTDHEKLDAVLCEIERVLGKTEACIELTDSVVATPDPWAIKQLVTRGQCLLDSGDLEAAGSVLEDLRTTIRSEGGNVVESRILVLAGSIELRSLSRGGSRRRAFDFFERALRLAPFNGGNAEVIGRALEAAGEHDHAEALYVRSLGTQPADPWINCRLGLLYVRQGRRQEALRHLRRALEVLDESVDIDFARRCVEEGRRLLELTDLDG